MRALIGVARLRGLINHVIRKTESNNQQRTVNEGERFEGAFPVPLANEVFFPLCHDGLNVVFIGKTRKLRKITPKSQMRLGF